MLPPRFPLPNKSGGVGRKGEEEEKSEKGDWGETIKRRKKGREEE